MSRKCAFIPVYCFVWNLSLFFFFWRKVFTILSLWFSRTLASMLLPSLTLSVSFFFASLFFLFLAEVFIQLACTEHTLSIVVVTFVLLGPNTWRSYNYSRSFLLKYEYLFNWFSPELHTNFFWNQLQLYFRSVFINRRNSYSSI